MIAEIIRTIFPFAREKKQLEVPANKNIWNRILDDVAREQFKADIEQLFHLTPKMMKRKIPRANIQQAFVFYAVQHFMKTGAKILCVGSHEDTACDALCKLGISMEKIDPVLNYDLNTYTQLESTKGKKFDIIFSTSVIEHVENDELFFKQFVDLLAPGGYGILTCDFDNSYKPGDFVFQGNYRFYTERDLLERIYPLLKNCHFVDTPQWKCDNPDFKLAGKKYTFASIVFQKNND